jgi:hypothetical protein
MAVPLYIDMRETRSPYRVLFAVRVIESFRGAAKVGVSSGSELVSAAVIVGIPSS